MNHLFDFPDKKDNLRLALLHGIGRCSYANLMHALLKRDAEKYQEILTFLKAEIVDYEAVVKAGFS